ncbi:hypothetical protein WAE61_02085 [Comamonadaceae bacterium PP-2]
MAQGVATDIPGFGAGFTYGKRIEIHPLLSRGSLYLMDLGHTKGKIEAIPAVNGTIPNVAWEKAVALIGSGTEAEMRFRVAVRSGEAENRFKLELTSKGGIHGLITQVNQDVACQFLAVAASPIHQYMVSNLSAHTYFFGAQSLTTRKGLQDLSGVHYWAQSTSIGVALDQGGFYGATWGTERLNDPVNGNGNAGIVIPQRRRSMTNTRLGGIGSGFNPSGAVPSIVTGLAGPFANTTTFWNRQASTIIRSAYCENLTASGRTFEQVRDLYVAYCDSTEAEGGVWHGDTWTNPTALP